uniref:(California timema) hypothetical protein n=1 Tax=Timema californicum TaxID=61474 RepID=A0A7R9JBS4_TIMCA|nr:unnamed protein product [Timema californicum]
MSCYRIKKDSGVSFKDMIFFDDEQRNIRDLTQHGVVSILVKNGVSFKVIEEGLLQFRKGLKSGSWWPLELGKHLWMWGLE